MGALPRVVAATVMAGLGGYLWTLLNGHPEGFRIEADTERFLQQSVVEGGLIQVAVWFAWVLGTWIYLRLGWGEKVTIPTLARIMGYAFLPMGLQLFIFPAGFEMVAASVALAYTGAAMVTGIEAATAASRLRVVVSVLAGLAIFSVILTYLGDGARDRAPGIYSLDPTLQSVGFKQLEIGR